MVKVRDQEANMAENTVNPIADPTTSINKKKKKKERSTPPAYPNKGSLYSLTHIKTECLKVRNFKLIKNVKSLQLYSSI
ncbi:hypothetical protein HanIR_Chr04g0175591 [Helianthus annuus]|nr:hypothetical protein HanIR_Chr04g0175591 [Helianthus annuus]